MFEQFYYPDDVENEIKNNIRKGLEIIFRTADEFNQELMKLNLVVMNDKYMDIDSRWFAYRELVRHADDIDQKFKIYYLSLLSEYKYLVLKKEGI